ncbi:MAG TPA: cupredoxin domain-containing protein [Terriglobales bacterium]|jgi:cytochrome c oxidase subunit II|nr:cupredoxin domain-containing protein [Terriglobales bacterium]
MSPRRILITMLVALAVFALAPRGTRAQDPKVINITAKRFEFSPNQITLKKGEPVKLMLTSADVTHGFFLKPLKIDEIIEPGKTTEVNLTPQTAGTYLLICDHFCGVNHAAMNMKIVVE